MAKKSKQAAAEFRHVNVLQNNADKQLDRFMTTLQQQKRYGTLASERELALSKIAPDTMSGMQLMLTK